jgi:spore coat protein CotH
MLGEGRMRSAHRTGAGVIVFAAVLALASVGPAAAQSPVSDAASVLFDASTLQEIRLRVNERDWNTLVENYGRDDYYPADLVWGDQIIHNIGIRSRGSGSRNPYKPGLKLDFNRYVSGQRLLGLNALVLDNLWQDDALIRERISMRLFEKMDVVAPREVFATVWVNELYLGVYAVVESVDSRFLRRPGLDRDGYLYDYEYQGLWWFEHLGEDLAPYEARFQPETREDDSAAALFGPIEQFVFTVNEPHQIVRDVGEFLDIEAFLRLLAVDTFLADWDGIVGDFGINNFYLYRPSASKQFTFIPWDKDNTFKSRDYPVWPDGMTNNVLTRQLMNVDALRDYYFASLRRVIDLVEAPVQRPDGSSVP